MADDVRTLMGAAYASAKAKALRDAAAPPKPPVQPAKAVTDMTPEEHASSKPKRAAEMNLAEYNAAKAVFIRGRRR